MSSTGLRVTERAVGSTERLIWASDAHTRVAVAIRTSRLGPSVGGVVHLPTGDSADAAGAAMRRAEAVTLAAVTGGAPLGGAAIAVLGAATDAVMARVGGVIDQLEGDVWVVPGLGEHPPLGRALAVHTRFAADPDHDIAGAALIATVADAWADDHVTSLRGVAVTVCGPGRLADATLRAARDAGAQVRHEPEVGPSPAATDIVINCAPGGLSPAHALTLECRLVVDAIGGPLDAPEVWDALTARGIRGVPGTVAGGALLRAVADRIASAVDGSAR